MPPSTAQWRSFANFQTCTQLRLSHSNVQVPADPSERILADEMHKPALGSGCRNKMCRTGELRSMVAMTGSTGRATPACGDQRAKPCPTAPTALVRVSITGHLLDLISKHLLNRQLGLRSRRLLHPRPGANRPGKQFTDMLRSFHRSSELQTISRTHCTDRRSWGTNTLQQIRRISAG